MLSAGGKISGIIGEVEIIGCWLKIHAIITCEEWGAGGDALLGKSRLHYIDLSFLEVWGRRIGGGTLYASIKTLVSLHCEKGEMMGSDTC